MELFKLAIYLDHDEDAFAELLEHKSNKDSMAERKAAESALAAATARSQELLRLYERVYEDNVNGKVTDDWFMRLSHKYEVEQDELKKQMFDLKNKLERLDTAQNSSGNFIRAIRKSMTMQTLTPIVLQELIDKIEVFPIEGRVRTERKGSSSITALSVALICRASFPSTLTSSTHGREWLSNISQAQYYKKEQTKLLPKTKK